ncbi:hypothetical protein CN311_08860 [Mesorhizobium sanjuanii]|uniref:Uncharacterized protein n=1 Tax=Mesorhizobium sanjuanii TaxID=2037900 RepID=A0A2A6FI53_9HYPH|nr:hypothetical protein CN311_08860 [Mesorhizobium sanjuanii]
MRPWLETNAFIAGCPMMGSMTINPPVYVLHRFADGGLVTKKAIRERFGLCKLVPCCTICNVGLGAFHGSNDNDRRREIVNWFLADDRYPDDKLVLKIGNRLIQDRLQGRRGIEIYEFPGVGRAIYINALVGLIEGEFSGLDEFPEWLHAIGTGSVATCCVKTQVEVFSGYGKPAKLRVGARRPGRSTGSVRGTIHVDKVHECVPRGGALALEPPRTKSAGSTGYPPRLSRGQRHRLPKSAGMPNLRLSK